MVKLIWPVLVLAGATLLVTAPWTVSGTIDIKVLLNITLDANNATNLTRRVVFRDNLRALVNLTGEYKPVFLDLYNKTLNNNLTVFELPFSLTFLGFARILPVFAPVAKSFVALANDIRTNDTTPPTNFSVLDFINNTAAMVNVSLDTILTQLSVNSTPNATVPKVFAANLLQKATLLRQFVPILNASFSAMTGTNVFKSIYLSVGASLSLANNFLTKLEPLVWASIVPGNLTDVLGGLVGQIGSITGLITEYLPTNLTLEATDPNWDFTCGTFFTDNLSKFNGLWNQTGSALIGLLNSTLAQNLTVVTAAIRGVGGVLPILANLTGQAAGILDGLTPKYNRRLYPSEVRLNRYKSDCHLRHLQRVNARRSH